MGIIPNAYFEVSGNTDVTLFTTNDGSEKFVFARDPDGTILIALDSAGQLEILAPYLVQDLIPDTPVRVL